MIPFSTQWGVSKSVIVRHGRFQGLVGALKSPCFCLRPRIWCCCGVRRRRKRLKSKIWTNAVEVYGYKVISCTFMYILWHSKSSWDFRPFRKWVSFDLGVLRAKDPGTKPFSEFPWNKILKQKKNNYFLNKLCNNGYFIRFERFQFEW